MHSFFKKLFYITLALYLITLCTVSYVGVYLTYIALPLIVIFLIFMLLTKPKSETLISKNVATAFETSSHVLADVSNMLDNVNSKLELHNLKHTNTASQQQRMNEINFLIKKNEIYLRNDKYSEEWSSLKEEISKLKAEKIIISKEISEIELQCELEHHLKHNKKL